MNHRPRRTTAVMVVVIIVALFGVLALLGSRHPKSAAHGHTSAIASVSATSSTGPGASGPGGNGNGGHGKTHGHKSKTTPTSPPTKIVALSSTPTSAIYPVGTDSYQVTVKASGPCWVLATSTSTGSTLWTGTLPAGASQVIPATGTITVELGSATGSPEARRRAGGVPDPGAHPVRGHLPAGRLRHHEPHRFVGHDAGTVTTTTAG